LRSTRSLDREFSARLSRECAAPTQSLPGSKVSQTGLRLSPACWTMCFGTICFSGTRSIAVNGDGRIPFSGDEDVLNEPLPRG